MFSVVVPTFNKQDLIARTIGSVLAQRHADFELIVVDDGSNDGTVDAVRSFDDPRLILVTQENSGVGGARNAGMARASRPWIALLDGDDYWFPDHLSELSRVIRTYPDVGMAATSYASGEAWAPSPPRRNSDRIERIDYLAAAGTDIGVIWSSAVAIRRDVAATVGAFGRHRRGEDQEYWVRTALRTPVARSHKVTAYYYRHAGGVMTVDHNRRETAPDRIEDMWPSVAFLRSVEADPAYAKMRRGMIAYERQATYLSIIGYVLRREFAVARRLARRLPGRHLDRAAAASAVLRLPDPLLRAGLGLHAMVKQLRRS